jgi:hypothetical protein
VIYSLRSGDDWLTDPNAAWRNSRLRPGMYKVQIAGPAPANLVIETSPGVQIMGELVKVIEKRLSERSKQPEKAVAAKQATPKAN